jgi:rhamnosyltransferase
MSHLRFSVVIPTRNGAASLPALLDSIWSQRTMGSLEIIAVDSGSTDDTLDVLAQKAVSVIEIPLAAFDHGGTRNLAIVKTRGEFIVSLVQDARLADENCLEALAHPFATDPKLAGTFARQLTRSDASALTRHYHARWSASATEGRRAELGDGEDGLERMSPAERLALCTFDNVASCIRRSVWEAYPFKTTRIAEDLEWARDVLLRGYSIAFVPDAVVEHSHERSAGYEYARTRLLHARLYDLFGLQTIPSLPSLALAIASSTAKHLAVEWRHPGQWARAAALAVAWPLGQYMGARRARRGDTRPRAREGKV